MEKKVPMRTCIACRSEKPKKELIRIVKSKEGVFSIDKTGKLNGRGAYLCDCKECAEKIIKKKFIFYNIIAPQRRVMWYYMEEE